MTSINTFLSVSNKAAAPTKRLNEKTLRCVIISQPSLLFVVSRLEANWRCLL